MLVPLQNNDHKEAVDVGNLKGNGHPDVGKRNGQPLISGTGKVKADIIKKGSSIIWLNN